MLLLHLVCAGLIWCRSSGAASLEAADEWLGSAGFRGIRVATAKSVVDGLPLELPPRLTRHSDASSATAESLPPAGAMVRGHACCCLGLPTCVQFRQQHPVAEDRVQQAGDQHFTMDAGDVFKQTGHGWLAESLPLVCRESWRIEKSRVPCAAAPCFFLPVRPSVVIRVVVWPSFAATVSDLTDAALPCRPQDFHDLGFTQRAEPFPARLPVNPNCFDIIYISASLFSHEKDDGDKGAKNSLAELAPTTKRRTPGVTTTQLYSSGRKITGYATVRSPARPVGCQHPTRPGNVIARICVVRNVVRLNPHSGRCRRPYGDLSRTKSACHVGAYSPQNRGYR